MLGMALLRNASGYPRCARMVVSFYGRRPGCHVSKRQYATSGQAVAAIVLGAPRCASISSARPTPAMASPVPTHWGETYE